jgi:hypothetical protein
VVRVQYDVDQAASAIIDSTLPDDFADYLRTGGRLTPREGLHQRSSTSA